MTRAQKKFVRLVAKHRPTEVSHLRKLGYQPRIVAEGAFRRAYVIPYLDVVVKFPLLFRDMPDNKDRTASIRDSKEHARCEIKAIRRILTEEHLLPLRRYMPEILYHDYGTGVTVVQRYRRFRWSAFFSGFALTFENLLNDLMPEMRYEFDSGHANFGLTEEGNYVLLDAGLIGEVNVKELKCR